MEPKELAEMMAMPLATRVEYQHDDGWSFATHSNGVAAQSYRTLFTAEQMNTYALAHKLYESNRWAKVLAESCADERSQLWEAGPGGGCSRAIEAESDLAKLRAAVSSIVQQRDRYGWGPEADAAIDAARVFLGPNVRLTGDPGTPGASGSAAG